MLTIKTVFGEEIDYSTRYRLDKMYLLPSINPYIPLSVWENVYLIIGDKEPYTVFTTYKTDEFPYVKKVAGSTSSLLLRTLDRSTRYSGTFLFELNLSKKQVFYIEKGMMYSEKGNLLCYIGEPASSKETDNRVLVINVERRNEVPRYFLNKSGFPTAILPMPRLLNQNVDFHEPSLTDKKKLIKLISDYYER